MHEVVYRCYVEKRNGFDVASKSLQNELSTVLGFTGIEVRLFNRYDIQNLSATAWPIVMQTVLSEPMCDDCFEDDLPPLKDGTRLLYIEPLPGQFDIRADSCEQCIQMLIGGERPIVRCAQVYAFLGMDEDTFHRVSEYLINPVESCEASPDKPDTLDRAQSNATADIPLMHGFTSLEVNELETLREKLDLAMSIADIIEVRDYFKSENRDPTYTELRVLDTYWSDHCRHTTFNTVINSAIIDDDRIQEAYDLFLSVNGDRPVTLMNIATAAMRHLRSAGKLPMLDISDEINACTIQVEAEFKHGREDWLVFFKNETHNHPTEIEPFGGAATCIGGAIRDPLSGRAYVYQSMRITGSGDPRAPIESTLPGKLPQRKLTTTAAEGFSSYGNQIGLATGYVKELYHDGYIAKRMEVGAVIGAAPISSIRRETPAPGDIVVVMGGRTGRDGIGGATGSSKTHGTDTVAKNASEVQKGNAPEERKLQRLFRNPVVARLIKRCNDFGAGGASVAIGELADRVDINLDAMPVKYMGMDGTELAISESQERMAVVIDSRDFSEIKRLAEAENIETSLVARVTDKRRLSMSWRGNNIVSIDRSFLDKNGAVRTTAVRVAHSQASAGASIPNKSLPGEGVIEHKGSLSERFMQLCGDLNFCSQKGLVERFDHSIGAGSVFEPFGGSNALTETQVMAALLPGSALGGNNELISEPPGTNSDSSLSETASVMSYGFDPYLTETDPFGGSAYAVVSSIAKLVAVGVPLDTIHLSLQEYFPRMNEDPDRWGLPFAAMLGAFSAQLGLGIAAIGGKDSMSGSFGEMDVPPTLISFAIGIAKASSLKSPEFKAAGNPVYLLDINKFLPDYNALRKAFGEYSAICSSGHVLSAFVCENGGAYGAIIKMAFGNMLGFTGDYDDTLLDGLYGSIVFESDVQLDGYRLLGYTQNKPELTIGDESILLDDLRIAWETPLESIFPTNARQSGIAPSIKDDRRAAAVARTSVLKPKAVIPVFPGTNCEYDTAEAVRRAGGEAEIVLICNLTPEMLSSSIIRLSSAISTAQMIIIPGGFSGGDEPDGSGKYIVSLFRNAQLSDAVHDLLDKRDGLILGICNGFQALIKLGLLPYGKIITQMTADCPTLTYNSIGRLQARYISARVSSVLSPWLSKCAPGEIYVQPISHGEGRLIAPETMLEAMKASGQIAFQYVDNNGLPSMETAFNPNGSTWAIEGISSRDGRILGKMAHAERYGDNVAMNVPGNKYLPLFEGGITYFK